MKIDHVLFETTYDGVKTWVCQITEEEKGRYWRAEMPSGNTPQENYDIKTTVMDKAFNEFMNDVKFEME
jgi:hypothetical protein